MGEVYDRRLKESLEHAVSRHKIKGRFGTLKHAKNIYMKASQGFYVSPGFHFDLAVKSLQEAGFDFEEATTPVSKLKED